MQRTWARSAGAYLRPRSLQMLGLGFSSGLPFLLVFSTLSAWLSDVGVSRAAIGAFGWIGAAYSIKVAWAPLVDRLPLPILDRWLGRRRSWMLLGQLGIIGGIGALSALDPGDGLAPVAWLSLWVALCSATQDVAVDAWRVEIEDGDLQGVLAAAYVAGYRLAMLAAGAGALWLAELGSWGRAYAWMAGLAILGPVATLWAPEPERRPGGEPEGLRRWIEGAVIAPFSAFSRAHRGHLPATLLLVGLFKVPDIVMAGMANPFLLELGYSKGEIAAIAKVVGFGATLLGAALGGVFVAHRGVRGAILPGVVGLSASNLAYAALAGWGGAPPLGLGAVVLVDNLSGGFATAVFVAWLSTLTTPGASATQYALLSSLMTLPAKLLSGFSGAAVDAMGWPAFFAGTALLGLPAGALALRIGRRGPRDPQAS